MIACIAFAMAVLCALLRCSLGNYIFSALTSVFSAAAVAACGMDAHNWPMAAGLMVSVAADWFLAHQGKSTGRFLCGVGLFFAAHCLFSVSAAMRMQFNVPALVVSLVLIIAYAAYMALRILPNVAKGLRIYLCLYALASIVSLYFAMSMTGSVQMRTAYTVGIAAILFSDTMIAENSYMGSRLAGRLVHPTYYLCHLLLAFSAIL